MFSRPASIRSRVDLPQPEGPTSTTNAPSSIGTVTPCKTSKPPNDLGTSLICTDAIHSLPNAENPRQSAGAVLVDRGHTRLFRLCPWIIVELSPRFRHSG